MLRNVCLEVEGSRIQRVPILYTKGEVEFGCSLGYTLIKIKVN